MTISLLRQIWQRIVDKQAPPRQRLTGFEPLEPRMVLSGFAAYFTPDYFSPPPGDYSHIDRSGAEYAKPVSVDFGRLADYNTPSAGVSMNVEPRFDGFVSTGPSIAQGAPRDLFVVSAPLRGDGGIDSGAADLVFSKPGKLEAFSGTGELSFSSNFAQTSFFAPSNPVVIEHGMDSDGGGGSASLSSRFAIFASYTPIFTPWTGSPLSMTEARGLSPGSYNMIIERRMEVRENVVEGAGGAPRAASLDAAFAHGTGVETTTRTNSSSNTAIALIASQSDGLRGGSAARTADGSTASGQNQGPANQTAAGEQSEIDEAYAVSRRGLKRKLPGDATALDETDGEDVELMQESGDTDSVLLLEAARQFDAAGNSGTQIPELALANFPADGLIDVLAADVESRMGDHKLLDTGRLVMVEPAMMAYQAFEMVIDRNSQAEGRVADAADVATVAMTEHPVVQVQ